MLFIVFEERIPVLESC